MFSVMGLCGGVARPVRGVDPDHGVNVREIGDSAGPPGNGVECGAPRPNFPVDVAFLNDEFIESVGI